MGRLLAVFGGLYGLLLAPLALTSPTSWLLIPAHFVFSVIAVLGIVVEAWSGHPGRARAWGGLYVVASVAVAVGLQLGSDANDGSVYWVLPWAVLLLWAWIPPALSLVAGLVAEQRRRRLSQRAVTKRRKARG